MHPIDHTIHFRRVMHRGEVASLSSRATLCRRVQNGFWWRPTTKTLAPRGVEESDEFWLLAALAHTWPHGALTGPTLAHITGRLATRPSAIHVAVPREASIRNRGPFVLHRVRRPQPQVVWFGSTRLAVDRSPESMIMSGLMLDTTTADWMLIDTVGSATIRDRRILRASAEPYIEVAHKFDRPGCRELGTHLEAVADGCQSPGEIAVWQLLRRLRVNFVAQQAWRLAPEVSRVLGSRTIYSDFWIPAASTVVEVDSSVHDHVRDVRRDTWLLSRGIYTVRIIGADVLSDPTAAMDTLRHGLYRRPHRKTMP